MTATIPTIVTEQVTQIRDAGPVNMMDSNGVQVAAFEADLYELVNWIEENPRDYMSLLRSI